MATPIIARRQSRRGDPGAANATLVYFASGLLRGLHTAWQEARDTPDEKTANWRAVCGKTARTVRREGRQCHPYPFKRKLKPGVPDAFGLPCHRHNQVFRLHHALRNALDVLNRDRFDLAIAPVDIIDAEIVELDGKKL